MEIHLIEEAAIGSDAKLRTLPVLSPSPWRSLGKVLDYTEWPDRERFRQLDALILKRQHELLELGQSCVLAAPQDFQAEYRAGF